MNKAFFGIIRVLENGVKITMNWLYIDDDEKEILINFKKAFDNLDEAILWIYDADSTNTEFRQFWLDPFIIKACADIADAIPFSMDQYHSRRLQAAINEIYSEYIINSAQKFLSFWATKLPLEYKFSDGTQNPFCFHDYTLIESRNERVVDCIYAYHTLRVLSGNTEIPLILDNAVFAYNNNNDPDKNPRIKMIYTGYFIDDTQFAQPFLFFNEQMQQLAINHIRTHIAEPKCMMEAIRAVRGLYRPGTKYTNKELHRIGHIISGDIPTIIPTSVPRPKQTVVSKANPQAEVSEAIRASGDKIAAAITKTNKEHPDPPPKKSRLPRCKKTGWSIARIAKEIGCCPETISSIMKDDNLSKILGYTPGLNNDAVGIATWALRMKGLQQFNELDRQTQEKQKGKRRAKYKRTKYNDCVNYDDARMDK